MIKVGARYPRKLHRGTRRVHALMRGTRPIYLSPEADTATQKMWLDEHVTTVPVMAIATDSDWFEVEITLPAGWTGSAASVYTGPLSPGFPSASLAIHHSQDLATWATGGWIDAPGHPPETLPDGRVKFRARHPVPRIWKEVMIDLTAETTRYGKSITGISVLGESISLPGYPYPMPSSHATLQQHLRANGFPGAIVSAASGAPLLAMATNHTAAGNRLIRLTMSGAFVTAAADVYFAPISLPNPHYPMPGSQATLQAHLRAAGQSGAVVRLYQNAWSVLLPDIPSSAYNRNFGIEIAPGDPYPAWDFFGTFLGFMTDAGVPGTSGNVRTPLGLPLLEAASQFARLAFAP